MALCQASLTLFREVRNRTGIVDSLFAIAVAVRVQGLYDQAEQYYKESLAVAQKLGFMWRIRTCLAGLGGLARERERLVQSARLLGSAENIGDDAIIPVVLDNSLSLAEEAVALRSQLAPATFAAAWAEGQAMTLDQAVNYALGKSDQAVQPELPG